MVAIILVFGLVAVFLVSSLLYEQLIQREQQQLMILTKEQAHETNIVLEYSKAIIRQVANSPLLTDYLSAKSKSKTRTKQLLDLLNDFNVDEHFASIYLIDATGQTLVSTNPSFIGKNYAFREYFTKAMSGQLGFDVVKGVTTGEIGYYFSVPIVIQDHVSGVLVGKMRPDLLMSEIRKNDQELPPDSGLEKYMTDKYGVIILTEESDRINKSLGFLPETSLNVDGREQRYGQSTIDALQYQAEMDAILQQSSQSQRRFRDDPDDKEEVVTMIKVDDYPLYVVTEMDMGRTTAAVNRVVLIIGFVVVSAAIIASLAISLLIIFRLRSLKQMRQLAIKIAAGDFDERIENLTNDELGDFGQAFNQMADALVDAKENVERQVEQRTAELTKLNNFMVDRELKMIDLKRQLKKDVDAKD